MAETQPKESRWWGGPYVVILGVVAVLGVALFFVGCLRQDGVCNYWAHIDIVDKIFYVFSALVVVIFVLRFAWAALYKRRRAPKDDQPDISEQGKP